MRARTITIKDVARESGVTAATVSYVLNNTRQVSGLTRERVLQVVRELNYHPSAVARGLSSKRMNTIGVVFPQASASPFSHPYFAPVLDGIADMALQEGQNTTLFTGHIWSDMAHSLPVYRDGRCDGLLLIAPPIESDIVPALRDAGVSFVLISDSFDDPCVSSVTIDDQEAGYTMVKYLLSQGHRRIAMLCGDWSIHSVPLRWAGYVQALTEFGIPYDEALVLRGGFAEPTIAERVEILLEIPKAMRPTALFCFNDEMALFALRDLQMHGVCVPEDISVVGIDDIQMAAQNLPALTTIRQPLHQIGVRSAEILLSLLRDEDAMPRQEKLPTELIVRQSVCPPRAA